VVSEVLCKRYKHKNCALCWSTSLLWKPRHNSDGCLLQADACPELSLPQPHINTTAFPLCPQQEGITLVLTFVPILRALAVRSVTPAALQAKPAKIITIKQPSKPQPAAYHFLTLCAKALKACPGGQSAIYCGGQALLQDHGSLVCLGKIAAATGALLICENDFPCINKECCKPCGHKSEKSCKSSPSSVPTEPMLS